MSVTYDEWQHAKQEHGALTYKNYRLVDKVKNTPPAQFNNNAHVDFFMDEFDSAWSVERAND